MKLDKRVKEGSQLGLGGAGFIAHQYVKQPTLPGSGCDSEGIKHGKV